MMVMAIPVGWRRLVSACRARSARRLKPGERRTGLGAAPRPHQLRPAVGERRPLLITDQFQQPPGRIAWCFQAVDQPGQRAGGLGTLCQQGQRERLDRSVAEEAVQEQVPEGIVVAQLPPLLHPHPPLEHPVGHVGQVLLPGAEVDARGHIEPDPSLLSLAEPDEEPVATLTRRRHRGHAQPCAGPIGRASSARRSISTSTSPPRATDSSPPRSTAHGHGVASSARYTAASRVSEPAIASLVGYQSE